MANNQIDYVELGASDLDSIKQFYSAVFGWTFTDYGPGYTSFDDGRLKGGFAKIAEPIAGRAGVLLVIYSSDLEAAEKNVTAAGGKVVKPIFSFPGGRRFQFTDPGGNELAVWSE